MVRVSLSIFMSRWKILVTPSLPTKPSKQPSKGKMKLMSTRLTKESTTGGDKEKKRCW